VTVSLLPIKTLNSPLVVNLEVRSNACTIHGVHMLLLKAAQLVLIALAFLIKMQELQTAAMWEVTCSALAKQLATTLLQLLRPAVPTLTASLIRTRTWALINAAQSMAPCCAPL